MYKASINLIKPREELVSDDKVLVVFNHRLSEVFLACPNYVVILSTESFGQFLRGGWVAGNYVLAAGPPVQETARVRLVG